MIKKMNTTVLQNTHDSVPKMLDVSGELHVMSY